MAVNLSIPILVVEDHGATVLILRALLKQLGFANLDEAADGVAALAKIREKRYALVISDVNMEPMGGLELLEHVRADEQLAKVRFVMITADMKAANVVAARQGGVDSFITKPFLAETLKAKIEQAFASS
jgi:two-component system chemotaxis response regulator CheY